MKTKTGRAATVPLNSWLKAGVAAGMAGGVAEVVFMAAYCLVSGKSGASVLSLITFTFFNGGIAFGPLGAFAGLLIHLVLSMSIGVFFSISMFLTQGNADRVTLARTVVSGAVLLTVIWAFNFFILLPNINPEFVGTVPAKVAFFSKLLFGLSLGVFVKLIAGTTSLKGSLQGICLVQE